MARNDFMQDLPAPSKQKWSRWALYAGTAVLGVVAINTFGPDVNSAITLLKNATWEAVDFAVAAVTLGAGTVAVAKFWPVYRDLVESLARKAAYGLLNQDPITPLKLWLKEVNNDRLDVYNAAKEVAGIVTSNLAKIEEYEQKAVAAQQRFEAAATSPKFGPNSPEAQDMANEAEHFNTLAEELIKINDPLQQLYVMLEETAKVVDATYKKAGREVEAAEVKWQAALETERGVEAAAGALFGGSARYTKARESLKVIHDRYAGGFGKLRSVRQMARTVFSEHDLNDAVSLQKAVARLGKESRSLLGHSAPAPQLAFAKRSKTAVPAAGSIRLFDQDDQ